MKEISPPLHNQQMFTESLLCTWTNAKKEEGEEEGRNNKQQQQQQQRRSPVVSGPEGVQGELLFSKAVLSKVLLPGS